MLSRDLTLILTLKGRPHFTLRYLWYANRCALRCKIVIADGEVREPFATLIENGGLFPNLDIDYVRYPDDASFALFYRKLADALRRVRTRYVMLTDNDDFVVPSGIARSIDFLTNNPTYVSCGGGVAGFSVARAPHSPCPHLVGNMDRICYRYSSNYFTRDLSAESASERVLDGYRKYMTTHYNVFRTPALAEIAEENVENNFSDLEVLEAYSAMRALVFGKIKSDSSCISYLRQYGTSLESAFERDWVHHLLRSRFSDDIRIMSDRIAGMVDRESDAGAAVIADEIRNIFGDALRVNLRSRYSPVRQFMRALRDRSPKWVLDLRELSRRPIGGWHKDLLMRLKSDGASEYELSTFRSEIAMIQDVLTGPDFVNFLSEHGLVCSGRGAR